jgi:hypothetical protein
MTSKLRRIRIGLIVFDMLLFGHSFLDQKKLFPGFTWHNYLSLLQ